MQLKKHIENTAVYESKFGALVINLDNKIHFPLGLIGLQEEKEFFVAQMPDKKLGNFTALQSAENNQLCFLTLPIKLENPFILEPDLKKAIEQASFALANTAILLICKTKLVEKTTTIVANAKAPLLVDIVRKVAVQYVLHNTNYSLQHKVL